MWKLLSSTSTVLVSATTVALTVADSGKVRVSESARHDSIHLLHAQAAQQLRAGATQPGGSNSRVRSLPEQRKAAAANLEGVMRQRFIPFCVCCLCVLHPSEPLDSSAQAHEPPAADVDAPGMGTSSAPGDMSKCHRDKVLRGLEQVSCCPGSVNHQP